MSNRTFALRNLHFLQFWLWMIITQKQLSALTIHFEDYDFEVYFFDWWYDHHCMWGHFAANTPFILRGAIAANTKNWHILDLYIRSRYFIDVLFYLSEEKRKHFYISEGNMRLTRWVMELYKNLNIRIYSYYCLLLKCITFLYLKFYEWRSI